MKIIAVSYFNTLPFIYGLKHSDFLQKAELELAIPSVCANKLIENKADIGLMPVGLLRELPPDFRIVTDYCIAGEGKVESVLLLSQKPLHEIDTIYLDSDSRTSVRLVKILAAEYWKINPKWEELLPGALPESAVMIGDKTFSEKGKYTYCYDLCEEWGKHTGLPFVFACWVANASVSDEQCRALNSALQLGIDNIEAVIDEISHPFLDKQVLAHYYRQAIQYKLDKHKHQAIDLFLSKIEQAGI